MSYYHVSVKPEAVKKLEQFLEKNCKGYKLWIPPDNLFEDCVFVDIDTLPSKNSCYVFKPLTPDLYRDITDDFWLKSQDKTVVDITDEVMVVGRRISFNGIVTEAGKDLVNVSGKVFNKQIKLNVPKDCIEKISHKRKKKRQV